MDKIRVLMVSNKEIFRDGLKELLKGEDIIQTVHTCCPNKEAVEETSQLKPDIVLLVAEPSRHAELIRTVRASKPDVKVIILTDSEKPLEIIASFKAGADGYVSEDVKVADLLKIITLVVEGEVIISAKVASSLLEELRCSEERKLWRGVKIPCGLTKREREVIRMVATGATNQEIAEALYISLNTVKVHLRNLMEKLNLHHRAELAAMVTQRLGGVPTSFLQR